MAKQHLYAKVPAKLSLYKKELSYDTFAVSKGINELYIKDNILKLCEYNKNYKYTDTEKQLILEDRMPPVYMSCFSKKTGELIQSCVSFLPEDFTGEAHGHFAHSLVLSDAETEHLITSPDAALFSPSNFARGFDDVADISVNSDAPSVEYPEHDYLPESVGEVSTVKTEYDPHLIHDLIYALLVTTSGKGSKSIYVDIDSSIDLYSQKSIELINKLLSVFPHHIKRRVSVISFSASARKSNMTFFNVKFVYGLEQQCSLINKSNSFIFDFKHNTVIGVKEEDPAYKKMKSDVDFLYNLLANEPKRLDFIRFACRMMPKAQDYKFESLSSIILLYNKITNTEADDFAILPDDSALYDLLCAYEKFKQYLSVEERCCVLGSLSRYSQSKKVIPANIFGKLQKIYPSDTKECRATVMEPILTLIHTDIMRDKLFQFIRKNYITETKEARRVIMENLTRVFYGQFLQTQLLSFFDESFSEEDEDVKENILKKLMASIRSEQIQDQILAFLDNHYSNMSAILRSIVRATMLEELPEADKLSQKIINFLEEHITDDEPQTQRSTVRSVFLRIEKADAVGDRRLIDLIFKDPYNLRPMSTQLLAVIILDLKNVKVFEYLLYNMLLGKSLDGVIDSISVLCGNYTEMPDEVVKALENGLLRLVEANRKKRNLFDYIALDIMMKKVTAQLSSELANKLYDDLYLAAIKPIITEKLHEAFRHHLREDCLSYVTEYISLNADYSSAPEFTVIVMTNNLYSQMKNHNAPGAIKQLASLIKTPYMTADASEMLELYFRKLYADDAKYLKPITPELSCEYFTALAIPYILDTSRRKSFGEVYAKCMAKLRALYIAGKQAEFRKKNKTVPENEIKVNNSVLAELTFKSAVDFCAVCKSLDVGGALVNLLFSSGEVSPMTCFFDAFVKENYPQNKRLVQKCAAQLAEDSKQLYELLEIALPGKIKKSGSALASRIQSLFKSARDKKADKAQAVTVTPPETEVGAPAIKEASPPADAPKAPVEPSKPVQAPVTPEKPTDAPVSAPLPPADTLAVAESEPPKSAKSNKRPSLFKKASGTGAKSPMLPSARMEKLPRAPKSDTPKDK